MEMEKIPAACAMEWSIDLEKGLRSRKPGKSVESIKKIGQRLAEWNKAPKLTVAARNIWGLVPGQDRLFADSILLRLAAVFATGDKDTRICVVKVFHSAFRHRGGKKDRGGQTMLVTMSLDNQQELLGRVRAVFNDGDVESRALCLICFGCLAAIAKDAAEVRFAILSSVTSSHVLEVKASLFAAGCISEFSNDFAAVSLEILINLLAAPSTSFVLRLAATQAFAKMSHSPSLASKAFKVGSELLRKYPEEKFSTAMMISLTKVAINSVSIIFEQFGLLFSFLNQPTTLQLRATCLRCIHYILKRKGSHMLIGGFSSENLFGLLYEADLPSPLRCEALKIVLKVISHMSPDMLLTHMHEFGKLFTHSMDSSGSKFISEILLEMQVIVDICGKLNGRMEKVTDGVCSVSLSCVTSLLCGRVSELKKLVPNNDWAFEIEKQLKVLLKLLLRLVNAHPQFFPSVLDELCSVIEHMVNEHGMDVDSSFPTSEVHVEKGDKSSERFMFLLYRFLVVCLGNLDEAEDATGQVFCRLKHLVNFICQCSLFSCTTHIVYALLLHSVANWDYIVSVAMSTGSAQRNPIGSLCNFFEDESLISECLRNMLSGDKWFAYTAGKCAASDGSWFIANPIFEKLSMSIRPCVYSGWLSALAQLSYLERQVQVLFMKVASTDSVNHVLSGGYIEKLAATCDRLSSTEKMLAVNDIPNQAFCFQRWFLGLRQKVLEVLVDILKLLATVSLGKNEQTTSADGLAPLQQMNQLQCFLVRISSKLERTAREYDLLASSFFDMDRKSLKVISSLTLSCSLLAFVTGFAYFCPNSSVLEDSMSCTSRGLGECLHVALVQNLIGPLCHIDSETCMSLISLLRSDGMHESFFHLPTRFPISKTCSASVKVRTACRRAVKEVACLQQESIAVHNEDGLLRANQNGAEVLLNVVRDWMGVPFQLPMYFFKVRSCMGAFLFASGFNSKNPTELLILQGSQLSLNLCLQLANVPPDLTSEYKKIYCILYCKTSSLIRRPQREPSAQKLIDHQTWTTDTVLHMHEKLQRYVVESSRDLINDRGRAGDHGVVEAFIRFETNGARQGFSTCLLDVSAFPVGSYRIHWHSGCVDRQGSYNTLLPLSDGLVFTIAKS